MLARDLMTQHPAAVLPTDSIRHAAVLMRDLGVGALPVVADHGSKTLGGMLTDRDIVVRCVAAGHDGRCRVGDHMTRDRVATARPEMDAHEVVARMERQQVRRLPVIGPDDRLLGIIAQADLVRRLGPREPEEIEALLRRISEPAPVAPNAPNAPNAPVAPARLADGPTEWPGLS